MEPNELQDHITDTYTYLRIGIAGLAIALPAVLYIGGLIRADLPLQGSMSAYYHAGGGVMRDVFVGVLAAVGVFLILYKGYTVFENWALNLAGIFLLIVAAVPMSWGCGDACPKMTLHGTAAVLFFFSIAYVCIFRSGDTLDLISDADKVRWYKKIYTVLGLVMIASPVIAVTVKLILQPDPGKGSIVFFIEAAGVVVFGFYWIVKSFEIRDTNAEQLALEGRLEMPPYGAKDIFTPIFIRRVGRAGTYESD
jgi:hypothetical protein